MSDYPNRPLIGVGVIALKPEEDGTKVLLIRRGKAPSAGRWSLPGGRQRLGEKVRETAAREVREETGCEVEILDLLDVVDSIHRDEEAAIVFHYTLVDFLALWQAGDCAAGGDALDAVWADAGDLGPFELWSETERVIGLAVERLRALQAEATRA